MFTSSSISSGLEFWSVNHTSTYQSSESNVFKNIFFWVKYLIIDQTIYLEQMHTRFFNFVDNYYWQYYNELLLIQWFLDNAGTCSLFSSFLILFLVLPSNFILSGVKIQDNILF